MLGGADSHSKLRFKVLPALKEDKTTAMRDLPFAVSETQDRYVNGLYWTAITDGQSGIAFFNRGTMGAVRESDGGFSVPLAYAMYYVWGTRMLSGDFVYEFAIYPFTGHWQQAGLHRRALEYNYRPVGLCTSPGNPPQADHTIQPVKVNPSAVVVSALYNIQDDYYVRLYEHTGRKRQFSLECMLAESNLSEVDLAGRELKVPSGSSSLRPWEIKTVLIRPRPD